jgi:hypothetical protein
MALGFHSETLKTIGVAGLDIILKLITGHTSYKLYLAKSLNQFFITFMPGQHLCWRTPKKRDFLGSIYICKTNI